jgi:hypothetical protein
MSRSRRKAISSSHKSKRNKHFQKYSHRKQRSLQRALISIGDNNLGEHLHSSNKAYKYGLVRRWRIRQLRICYEYGAGRWLTPDPVAWEALRKRCLAK